MRRELEAYYRYAIRKSLQYLYQGDIAMANAMLACARQNNARIERFDNVLAGNDTVRRVNS
jgi:hypothetical protein